MCVLIFRSQNYIHCFIIIAHTTTASAQVNYPNMNYGGQPSQSEHLSAGTTGLPDSTVVPPPAADQVQTDTKTNNEGSDDSQDQKPNENGDEFA